MALSLLQGKVQDNSVVFMTEGAGGGIVSGIRRGAGSSVPSVVGSPLGGAGVINTGSLCRFGAASSGGLSDSSPISTA